ncbi:hypothetical protein [Cytobacillus sp. IB215665]|uniref:hypothetical protein n=1 Tax=Cytobacillus sp. IB215665 TaxID=3097357 RepID=UPI002A0C8EE5|nr:hypothetical protein [Cytobacillus sp. IB215665]MDX8367794.1 hypothetical protein [Cytobacillus sp. IB215665]
MSIVITSTNPYIKTDWLDEIEDPTEIDPATGEPKILQHGTKYTAQRANNIENGIFNAYEWLIQQASDIQKLEVQMEIDGRVPGNSGAFFVTFEGDGNRITLLSEKAVVIEEVSAGATSFSVDGIEGFEDFTVVTIYDDENNEDIMITNIDTATGTITIQGALVNGYKKGAVIARSNSENDGRLTFGEWSTFTISVNEVI